MLCFSNLPLHTQQAASYRNALMLFILSCSDNTNGIYEVLRCLSYEFKCYYNRNGGVYLHFLIGAIALNPALVLIKQQWLVQALK